MFGAETPGLPRRGFLHFLFDKLRQHVDHALVLKPETERESRHLRVIVRKLLVFFRVRHKHACGGFESAPHNELCEDTGTARPRGTLHMDMSDPVHLAEDLLERVAQGNLTFTKREVKKIAAMLDLLAWRCGDAYQVVGNLADFAGMKDDRAVIKAMDLLAFPMRRGNIGPFVTQRHRQEFRERKKIIAAHEAMKRIRKKIARKRQSKSKV